MPWLIPSLPWLVFLTAAWPVSGLFVPRALLRACGPDESCRLRLPGTLD